MGAKRKRFKQTDPLETRLAQFAEIMREQTRSRKAKSESRCSSGLITLTRRSTWTDKSAIAIRNDAGEHRLA